MAYLDRTKLTCPSCGLTDTIRIVVGVGPHSRKGDVPYRTYHAPGPFAEERDDHDKKTGRLLCPRDQSPVWTNKPGRQANTS